MSGPDYIPGYWQNESSGVLRPAVEAYLAGGEMTAGQIRAMRAYCRMWINAPGFLGPRVELLRNFVDGIVDRETLAKWLDHACEAGCDPL